MNSPEKTAQQHESDLSIVLPINRRNPVIVERLPPVDGIPVIGHVGGRSVIAPRAVAVGAVIDDADAILGRVVVVVARLETVRVRGLRRTISIASQNSYIVRVL